MREWFKRTFTEFQQGMIVGACAAILGQIIAGIISRIS